MQKEYIDLANVCVTASVPIIVATCGWILNQRLKSIEQTQWQNRRIIELRLDVFREVTPKLNAMFCYCSYVGDWKLHSPEEIVLMKRETDKTIHVYRYLLSEELFGAYEGFVETIFQTWTGTDGDAKLRTAITGPQGNRPATYAGQWREEWSHFFMPEHEAPREKIAARYEAVMEAFRACIGLKPL